VAEYLNILVYFDNIKTIRIVSFAFGWIMKKTAFEIRKKVEIFDKLDRKCFKNINIKLNLNMFWHFSNTCWYCKDSSKAICLSLV
jgi:hypothetical protein